MEAPEKVFLHPDIGGKEFIKPWLKRPFNENSIEYLRTDVFIEKACEWLKEIFSEYESLTDYNPMNDFKNYMKGE